MDSNHYLQDIKDIKQMMSQSSQFISLSGLSGILAGIYCLTASLLAYKIIYFDTNPNEDYSQILITQPMIIQLLIIAATVIILSFLTAVFLSNKKAQKRKETIWNTTSKRLLINFMIPLVTGGIFILFLIEKEILTLIAPLSLIFYGLACINASKYTLGDIRYLGITMIISGLLSTGFPKYGLFFWALGFGLCHIVYGTMMFFKYDKK